MSGQLNKITHLKPKQDVKDSCKNDPTKEIDLEITLMGVDKSQQPYQKTFKHITCYDDLAGTPPSFVIAEEDFYEIHEMADFLQDKIGIKWGPDTISFLRKFPYHIQQGPTIEVAGVEDKRVIWIPKKYDNLISSMDYLGRALLNVCPQAYAPFVSTEALFNQLISSDECLSYLTSYYICALLYLMQEINYDKWLLNLVSCKESFSRIKFISPNFKGYDSSATALCGRISKLDIIITGFISLAAIAKEQSKPDHIDAWLNKRIPTLLISCGLKSTLTPKVSYCFDTKIIADFFNTMPCLRKTYRYYFLTTNFSNIQNQHFTGVLRQSQMVLEWRRLSTFQFAYNFACECETEVHLNLVAVRESERLIQIYDKYDTMHGTDFKYMYFLDDLPKDIEHSNYPTIAVAAIIQKKGEEVSFKNSAELNLKPAISKDTIIELLKKKLVTTTASNLDPQVEAYLSSKGRSAPQPSAQLTIQSLVTAIKQQLGTPP